MSSINTRAKREQRRERVRQMAGARGVALVTLPSGAYHLKGKGVDLKVIDLADVYDSDFLPGMMGYP